jgi:hypothetical protein
MKKLNSIWMFFAALMVAVIFAGCAGDPSSAPTGTDATGRLSVRVDWGRAIPPDTAAIDVWACGTNGARMKNVRLTYPTTEGTITGIPSGPGTVKAYALNSAEVLLASGATEVQIVANTDNTATVELEAVDPPVADDRYVIGGSVSVDPDDPTLIRITLNALVNRLDGKPAIGLTDNNFAVYEDGIRKRPITVEQTSGVSSKTDIAFVVDTTGSMGGEIAGVRDSIVAFVNNLSAEGHDVRLAGIEYGDDIRTSFDFTSDPVAFQTWIAGLGADGGGDGPENPLDSIVRIVETQTWRPDAQHMIIVLTDATCHEEDWATTRSMESVRDLLIGRFVVHSISPNYGAYAPKNPGYNGKEPTRSDRDIKVLTDFTGGVWAQMPYDGNINLSELPIFDAILAGYLVKFRSNMAVPPIDREIRLTVTEEGTLLADQIFAGRY